MYILAALKLVAFVTIASVVAVTTIDSVPGVIVQGVDVVIARPTLQHIRTRARIGVDLVVPPRP